jgi:hypothetical protein
VPERVPQCRRYPSVPFVQRDCPVGVTITGGNLRGDALGGEPRLQVT